MKTAQNRKNILLESNQGVNSSRNPMNTLIRTLSKLLLVVLLLNGNPTLIAQTGYIFTGAKNIKPEHVPKPRDFKLKAISWGEMDSKCRTEVVQYGNWFKVYPVISKLQITIGTGLTFGTIADPYIYVGYIDTINGVETLVEHKCGKYQGDMGQFRLEVFNLKPERLYYLFIGGTADKQTYELQLTQRFSPENPPDLVEPEKKLDNTATNETAEAGGQASETATTTQQPQIQIQPEGTAIIIGRIRDASGNPIKNKKVMLLNDDLQQVQEVATDAYGGYRFEGVNPDRINLVKMSGDDSQWLIDMFMYDDNFDVIGKPISLGHRLHSFKARKDYFSELAILTQEDVFVDVTHGMSYMSGKVVDRETYLVGREGVKVGLYTSQKSLLKTTVTDLNGKFSFTELDNQEYIVKVEHNPDEDYVEIVIADSFNVPYASANSNQLGKDGYFKFKALPKEIVELRRMEVMEDRGMSPSATASFSKSLIDEGKVGVAIELNTIEFNTGSAQLTLAKNRELDQLAEELLNKPNIRIKIDGHTDNVGNFDANMRLSDERAAAVKAYLVGHGVASSRIQTEGFGSKKPIATNDTEEGRSKNRRVEFTIVN
jgi:outer membrane protein OmpA-like peptidoglycan-associated protein